MKKAVTVHDVSEYDYREDLVYGLMFFSNIAQKTSINQCRLLDLSNFNVLLSTGSDTITGLWKKN